MKRALHHLLRLLTLPLLFSPALAATDLTWDPGTTNTGVLAMGAEGTRFFKASAPSGTPAWSLWLNGAARDIKVRKDQAPVQFAERGQNSRLLLVPPYLDNSTVFIAVDGNPGESINLDSRIQTVTDIAFSSTQTGVSFSGAPFKLYRVSVPPEQLGWDVSVTPTAGDANVAVRRDQARGEADNDAFSEVSGNSVDSVTLVPPSLTDGTWFILVYGPGAATFTLNNGSPVPVAINFTDTKVMRSRRGWAGATLRSRTSRRSWASWGGSWNCQARWRARRLPCGAGRCQAAGTSAAVESQDRTATRISAASRAGWTARDTRRTSGMRASSPAPGLWVRSR